MKNTQDLLTEALDAAADTVRPERVRPLAELRLGAQAQPRRWRAWLVPVAAAASVALVVGLAVAVTRGPQQTGSGPAAGAAVTAASFPKYFVEDTDLGVNAGDLVQVRSTSTGSVIASVPRPKVPGWYLDVNTLGAGPGGRTFYVAFVAIRPQSPTATDKYLIYRLSITSSGTAMPLTPIKGGAITIASNNWYDPWPSLAVSPDGSKLAVTLNADRQYGETNDGKIVVIDMPTGTQHVWQGGLYRPGTTFSVKQLSWTADSRSLVFLGVWCGAGWPSPSCAGPTRAGGSRYTQVRSINVATGSGTLDRSVVLLAQSARYQVISSAIAGPSPHELDVVVLSGTMNSPYAWSNAEVERVSTVNGALLGVSYRWVAHGNEGEVPVVGISSDPGGHYVLFHYPSGKADDFYTGWIDGGKLHFLPPKQPYPVTVIPVW